MKTIQQRFDEKWTYVPPSNCWIWTAHTNNKGYGVFKLGGRPQFAHRVSYLLHSGSIPQGEGHHGTCVMHSCDVRLCVNPSHLILGTHDNNMQDMTNKGRQLTGEDKPNARLTELDIVAIRADHRTNKDIAIDYGVCSQHIGDIKHNKRWGHVVSTKAVASQLY